MVMVSSMLVCRFSCCGHLRFGQLDGGSRSSLASWRPQGWVEHSGGQTLRNLVGKNQTRPSWDMVTMYHNLYIYIYIMYITYIHIYIYISSDDDDDDDDDHDHDHDDLYVFVSIMILIDSSDPPGETSALGSRLQIGVRRLATDRRWPELNGWTRGHFVDPSNKDTLWLFNIAMGNGP